MSVTEKDIAVLKDFEARLNEMMALIGDKRFLAPAEKQDLQHRLKSLKGDMKSEAKRASAISSIVMESLCRIRVATNTHPINSDWTSCLYSACADLRYAIRAHARG